jgi:hypothetical protein
MNAYQIALLSMLGFAFIWDIKSFIAGREKKTLLLTMLVKWVLTGVVIVMVWNIPVLY